MHHLLSKYFFYYPVTLAKGEFVARYLKTYEKFQYLSKNEIQTYQIEKVNKLLNYAIKEIPYYKALYNDLFSEHPVITELSDLSCLPPLSKAALNKNSGKLRANLAPYKVSRKTTGGSTGQAVTIYKNVDALARERAATWRAYAWANIGIGDPQARFWGVPITQGNRLKYELIDIIANRKRLSAFVTDEYSLDKYYAILLKFKPKYLYGYVSIIELFIKYLQSRQRTLPDSVKCIITTSEVLTDSTRTFIEDYTQLKIYNEYGCGETGSIAHECAYGNMHLMSDNLIVEILDSDGNPANTGEIVVTDLFNYAMPLIRYRLADFAELAHEDCACGIKLPMVKKIHGRAYDMLIKQDGSKAHPELIMYIFEEIKENNDAVKQFQLIQDGKNHFTINLVTSDDINTAALEESLKLKINHALDNSNYKYCFHYVQHIPREKSGKIRLVKVQINSD